MKPRYARNYIEEFLRVLVPGGLIIFQYPSNRPTKAARGALIKNLIMIFWRRLKYGKQVIMEMYGMRQEDVIKFLKKKGAKILDVTQNQDPMWISFWYIVSKE